MCKILSPDESHDSIYDIDLAGLYAKGYRNILIDVDNTITHWNSDEITEKLEKWIKEVQNMGFSICLFSNNKSTRIGILADSLGVMAVPTGGKPLVAAFNRALLYIDASHEETMMIGDQIFTDVWGANRINLYTILVKPISNKEFWGTKVNRILERILMGRR